MDKNLSIQEYLSIGYLYLLVIGILSEAIFYGILGIAYLDYTTVLDALISPISLLTNNYKVTLSLLILIGLLYWYILKRAPKSHKKYRDKGWYKRLYNVERWDKVYEDIEERKNILQMMMMIFFMMFLSLRLGMAMGTKKRLMDRSLKPSHSLVFKNNEELNVKKIGQNSMYLFYVLPNEDVITITPISDNIKQIKRLNSVKK